jgi:hypothetical protein
MLVFEAAITRILGVAAMFPFIVCGVFLIADPAFLREEEDDASEDSDRGPALSAPPVS